MLEKTRSRCCMDIPCYRWGKWDSESGCNLSRVTLLAIVKARIETQVLKFNFFLRHPAILCYNDSWMEGKLETCDYDAPWNKKKERKLVNREKKPVNYVKPKLLMWFEHLLLQLKMIKFRNPNQVFTKWFLFWDWSPHYNHFYDFLKQ